MTCNQNGVPAASNKNGSWEFLRLQGSLLLMTLLIGTGCPRDSVDSGGIPAFRWHFAGGDALRNATDAPLLSKILQLPEADGVSAVIGTNLAREIGTLLKGSNQMAPAMLAQLNPMARELLSVESAGEIRRGPKGEWGWAVAARLDSSHMTAWREVLSNLSPVPVVLAHTNGWLLAGTAEKNLRNLAGYAWTPHRRLLSVDFDAAEWPAGVWPAEFLPPARVKFFAYATNSNVRSEARMHFTAKLPFVEDAWQMPEAILHDPIVSFTAVRGVSPLLLRTEWFQYLQADTPPNQIFTWSQPAIPFRFYFATPVTDPDAMMDQVARRLAPLFSRPVTNRVLIGDLRYNTNLHQLLIERSPGMIPAMFPLHTNGGSWIVGGFYPAAKATNQFPPELYRQLDRKGILAFDWEDTGEAFIHWRAMMQARDIMLIRTFIPATGPANRWLGRASTNLQEAVTQCIRTSPTDLEITRKSSVGLTGIELAALARWVDAPIVTARPRGPARPAAVPSKNR